MSPEPLFGLLHTQTDTAFAIAAGENELLRNEISVTGDNSL